MLARDLGHLFDADFGDDGLGGVKMRFVHDVHLCDYRDFVSSPFCELRDRKVCADREYRAMSDPQREIRTWMQSELARRGHGAKGALAEFLGVRPDAITRMANADPKKETREIRAHELVKMREFFSETSAENDEDLTTVPLVGYVGAGAAAHFYAESQGELDRVKAPKDATKETVAVQIRGESLGALFDTWLVYYDDVRSPVTSDMIGILCVVGLQDDRVLVKRIRKARTPGFFHLESNTEPTINDIEIAWAAKVKSMEPR